MSARLIPFVRQLLGATNAGRLRWAKDAEGEGFLAVAQAGSVRIAEDASSADSPPVTWLELLTASGSVIDSLSTEPDRPGAWRDWESDLIRLYEAAELDASGANDLLRALEDEWNLPKADDDIPF